MKTIWLTDEIKIDKILDIILTDNKSNKYLIISRVDCFYVNFYFQIDDKTRLYFKVFNPSIYGNNILNKRELDNHEN